MHASDTLLVVKRCGFEEHHEHKRKQGLRQLPGESKKPDNNLSHFAITLCVKTNISAIGRNRNHFDRSHCSTDVPKLAVEEVNGSQTLIVEIMKTA